MENIQLVENCKFSYAPSGNTIDRLAATNFELSGGLKGDCISKGNYWIPDFVLVVERTDAITKQKYLETIIVDAKLSGTTGWTPNQNIAKDMNSWSIKAIGDKALIKGTKIDGFDLSSTVTKRGEFIKLYNESGAIKVK